MRRLAFAMLMLVVVVGCGRNGEPQTIASPDATAAETSEPDQTPAATPCVLEGVNEQSESEDAPSDADGPAFLTEVRFTPDGCPRVAFVFENHVPEYRVGYEDGDLAECGSGETIETDDWGASAFITFHSNSASGVDLSKDPYRQTYTGDKDIDVDAPVLRRIRQTCDFEATLEWAIAVDERRPFRVFTLKDPPRLVVDVSAGS